MSISPFSIGRNLATMATFKKLLYLYIGSSADVNFSDFFNAFHLTGSIYSISPGIILEFFHSDNSCNNLSRMDANPDFKKQISFAFFGYFII